MSNIDTLIKKLQEAKEELSKGVNCAPGGSLNTLAKDSVNPDLAPKEVKVKQLQAQIDAGTYKPDPKAIADKMIGKADEEHPSTLSYGDVKKLIKEELTCSENGQWNLMEKNDNLRDLSPDEWHHLRSMKYPAAMKPHVKVHKDTMEIHEHGRGVKWRMPPADRLVTSKQKQPKKTEEK